MNSDQLPESGFKFQGQSEIWNPKPEPSLNNGPDTHDFSIRHSPFTIRHSFVD